LTLNNLFVAYGDALTAGITKRWREWPGVDSLVDRNSREDGPCVTERLS
jgi:hypothetical protein